ncbi:MAG: acetyl/propionyl/methylcrotonyl-CoA carboxylase subunit alpha [Alphaproteobacteria bacterium]|nr:acetyl/propionyl/methylcrotonyl-CoA carboxylase subunit alpha [Alphaproteobacteria bacterium]
MFDKILIANRGEIACRIIRTARRLGIATVAVFSDADRFALHVEMADEAVHIGPAPVSDSYLDGERLIAAARATGSDAVHPGYGFLSENPDFVEAVEAAGLCFIGPSSDAIRAMGLKDAAKTLMEKAGVPVVPGYHGEAQDLVVLASKANEIGFPVLIKARAGGGGKGMRLVDNPQTFADSLSAAKREGEASFGDGRVLVEKFVSAPRHIEIQVFGDSFGNVVHLFERDCSLQRRHQKVIEEAPAPGMTDEMRAAMGAAAVQAAKAIGYSGAGTVEFIVDSSQGLSPDRFYFMEMNTRLQVEHPVTEMITGLDLVEWQLRVAAGESLPMDQGALSIDGWSFEARLYAENAQKAFLPATGKLDYLRLPDGAARVDSGVRQGDEITPFYDPMIAKIITHGPNRVTALRRMEAALAKTVVVGTTTNVAFLGALCRHGAFARGDVDTGLIERALTELNAVARPSDRHVAVAALASLGLDRCANDPSDPFSTLGLWSHWLPAKRVVHLVHDDVSLVLAVNRLSDHRWLVEDYPAKSGSFGPVTLDLQSALDGVMTIDHDGTVSTVQVVRHQTTLVIVDVEGTFSFTIPDMTGEESEDASGSDRLTAPMPGIVKQVHVRAGESVESGQALIIMEAMKMEITLAAPRDGVIAEILAGDGAQVSDGDVLLRLEALED